MAKAAKARLAQALNSHIQSVTETLQILDVTAAGSQNKVEWSEVIKLGDEISKQATIAGMLWSGDPLNGEELVQNMGVYFNALQGFLLHCHGSMVGAGPTLRVNIRASAKQVTDSSFSFFKEAVPCYASAKTDRKLLIPRLTGSVWEACAALKKAPTSNYTAIGRAMTQVAVSIKDVLREMKELKVESSSIDQPAGNSKGFSDVTTQQLEDDSLSMEELGNDLSPEEMAIGQSTICVISDSLLVVKELIRLVSGLAKRPNDLTNGQSTNSLEQLLEICRGIGGEIDELGACVYPPQEISQMQSSGANIYGALGRMRAEILTLQGSSDGLSQACISLENALLKFGSVLRNSDSFLEEKMKRLSV